MRLRRRTSPVIEQEPQIDPDAELQLRAAEAVMGFRHRLDTDQGFRQSFGGAIKEALARTEASAAQEAEVNAEAYSGNTVLGQELTERAKAAKGALFEDVLGMLRGLTSREDESVDVAAFIYGLKTDIGMAVNEAYAEGLQQPHPNMWGEGSLGTVHPELGWIVPIERLSATASIPDLQAESRQAREATRNFFDQQGGN